MYHSAVSFGWYPPPYYQVCQCYLSDMHQRRRATLLYYRQCQNEELKLYPLTDQQSNRRCYLYRVVRKANQIRTREGLMVTTLGATNRCNPCCNYGMDAQNSGTLLCKKYTGNCHVLMLNYLYQCSCHESRMQELRAGVGGGGRRRI